MTLRRLALVASCLSLWAVAASAADADPVPYDGAATGLRMRSFGPLPGAAVVDFALPGISSLLRAGPERWLREATGLSQRLSPALRLNGDTWTSGGLRASAGVVNVSRATAYGAGPAAEQLVIDTVPRLGGSGGSVVTASAPYVGIGWREVPAPPAGGQGAWGFNADLGLLALAPRSTVRFGRSAGGPLTMDDMVRDLRFAPMLQLGVTYSF